MYCLYSTLHITQDKRTMSSQQKHRIQVPDGLRDVLLEFSIAYLLEQPGDVIDYAVTFFTKLQEDRKTTMITSAEPTSPDESIMSHDEVPSGSVYPAVKHALYHYGWTSNVDK
uniref:RIIa domain-containing protein n=1 Tax=Anopheles merus TaxID=30066 RepID=A0A182V532_ANOME